MKAEMLVSIRSSAGLGDNFYYNIGSESINSSLKKEIDKQKQHSSPGKPSKCSNGEFIDIQGTLLANMYRRNVHREVKGGGPYQLAPEFSELEVTEEIWRGLSPRERVTKIYSIDQGGANLYKSSKIQASDSIEHQACEVSTSEENPSSLPVDLSSSGLPPTFEATWNNANAILKKQGVTKVSGTESTFAVISLMNPFRPHIVNSDAGKIRCDCDGFKQKKICSHGLAVAYTEDVLHGALSKWVPNFSSIIQDTIPKRSGKKLGLKWFRPSHTLYGRAT